MSTKSFWSGLLAGVALTVALGAGLVLVARTAAAGAVERVGGALVGALRAPDAPATGRLALQGEGDAADEGAAEAEDGTEADAEVAGEDDPCAGKHGFRMRRFHGGPGMTGGPAEVGYVEEGSAAEAAGLQPGDVITAVDGEAVGDGAALAAALGARAPGDEVALAVERDGEPLEVVATLGAHPDDATKGFLGVGVGHAVEIEIEGVPGLDGLEGLEELEGHALPFGMGEGGTWFEHEEDGPFMKRFRIGPGMGGPRGMGFFSREDLEALGVDGLLEGAAVGEVVDDGPAAAAGLQPGDLITAVDGEAVDGAEALIAALADRAPGEAMELTVARPGEGGPLTLVATLDERPATIEADEGDLEDDGDAAASRAWLGVSVGTVQLRFGEGAGGEGFAPGEHLREMHDHLRQRFRGGEAGAGDEGGEIRFEIGPGGVFEMRPAPRPSGLDLGGGRL